MLGEELRPGLWRWTAHYDVWGKEVAAIAVVTAEDLVLIDPLFVGDQWEALESDLGGRELHVLLTIHWHARSAKDISARFPAAHIWANSRDRAAVGRRAPVTDIYRTGDELPANLVAIEARPRSEVLFWEPRSKALIVGDALLGDGENGEGLDTCPGWWLPTSASLDDLRAALRPALDLPIEMVLPSHGAPVFANPKEELAAVVSGDRR